jgi:UDP-4-amino-4,6-dideoxy-N-acetyl-beta-L-altrosamine N-acetyltransferase
MNHNHRYSVRTVSFSDLPQLLGWRNHPAIRAFMLTDHQITQNEHLEWFQSVSIDHDRCLLMIERDDLPMGYVQFTGITSKFADWGFYVAPGSPKGSGRVLARLALSYAFQSFSLIHVRGKALAFNQPSIRLHLACGFQQLATVEQVMRSDGRSHELYSFVLTNLHWLDLG